MSKKKRAWGLTLFSIGIGMIIVLIIPGFAWLLVIAIILLLAGFGFIRS